MKLPERRRFVRIDIPLKVVVKVGDYVEEVITKNVSPIGLRFEINKELAKDQDLSLSLYLPSTDIPVDLEGKVVWQKKVSLEDKAPYDVGVEILDIDSKTKNAFLRYLCDLLYNSTFKART